MYRSSPACHGFVVMPEHVDEDMDMIGHNHKAHTHAVILAQLIRQEMNDNALGAIIVKKTSPFVAGKSDKVAGSPGSFRLGPEDKR